MMNTVFLKKVGGLSTDRMGLGKTERVTKKPINVCSPSPVNKKKANRANFIKKQPNFQRKSCFSVTNDRSIW